MAKTGIYWNGEDLSFGFWILQRSGKLYFSGNPVDGGRWSLAEPQSTKGLQFLCGLNGSGREK